MLNINHARRGTVSYVGKLVLFVTPMGEIVVMSGNQRMTVSREEAQELFDYLLGFASKFQTSKQALPVSMG